MTRLIIAEDYLGTLTIINLLAEIFSIIVLNYTTHSSVEIEIWDLLKSNSENTELIRNIVFIIFTILNFFLGLISFIRSTPNQDILDIDFEVGECYQFKRNRVPKLRLKIDFSATAVNYYAYIKSISISKPTNKLKQAFSSKSSHEIICIKKIQFYLSGWPSCVPLGNGWEYGVMKTLKLPINKALVDHQMQYRRLIGERNNCKNFNDAWGKLDPQEWVNIDGSLQIPKNSCKHFTLLFELVLHEEKSQKNFLINEPANIKLNIEFNQNIVSKQVSLEKFVIS
ncbi:MAG: hypothetical protein AAF892_04020 [Cyanobacteria bacterium P01_D01_bin.71]